MRQLPSPCCTQAAPVLSAGQPAGYANMTEWQKDNGQQVIEQAPRGALHQQLAVQTAAGAYRVGLFHAVPTLIDGIPTGLVDGCRQPMGYDWVDCCSARSAPRCSTMRGVQWPSFIPVMALAPDLMHRCWWASTDRQPLRRHGASAFDEASRRWTCGVARLDRSGDVSGLWGWIGEREKREAEVLAERPPAGKSSIRMSAHRSLVAQASARWLLSILSKLAGGGRQPGRGGFSGRWAR